MVCQLLRGVSQQARHPVQHSIGVATDPARHGGGPTCCGLGDGHPPALSNGCARHYPSLPVGVDEVRSGHGSSEFDDVADPEGGDKVLECGPVIALTNDHEPHIGYPATEFGERLDEVFKPLVWDEPTDGKDGGPLRA